jgi:hypothetical protein
MEADPGLGIDAGVGVFEVNRLVLVPNDGQV